MAITVTTVNAVEVYMTIIRTKNSVTSHPQPTALWRRINGLLPVPYGDIEMCVSTPLTESREPSVADWAWVHPEPYCIIAAPSLVVGKHK